MLRGSFSFFPPPFSREALVFEREGHHSFSWYGDKGEILYFFPVLGFRRNWGVWRERVGRLGGFCFVYFC